MENLLTVREIAETLQKSEETVKRWLRSGKFPNAYKENDKQGWRIPHQDLQTFLNSNKHLHLNKTKTTNHNQLPTPQDEDSKELVLLAYQAVTMTSPTESMMNILSHIGIKRTLEILLIMQQSPNKVKNPEGFIKKAISKGWIPTTLPIKKDRNIARIQNNRSVDNQQRPLPFYNWLEQD
ncbi:helix-turn-helix domain-containing protein [Bacillus benzoevorans]|uniref:Excisionase family DNA binding protein n=1 Tax=Bacillus benzoevorans TaxID=1456 RepID=A0A7X0HW77_9BACI|nr:helix-turn-helix domain-containing protein [Bacillus benzoevorans]MBB6448020.1 excisionase family DNA binding protein [Bacillus benzoevorans]